MVKEQGMVYQGVGRIGAGKASEGYEMGGRKEDI